MDGRSRTSAQQYDTVVVAVHRGQGLGAFLKAALLEHVLREEAPGLEEVVADNADDNVHMLRVNLRLGYVPVRRVVHVQRALQGAPAVNPRGGR